MDVNANMLSAHNDGASSRPGLQSKWRLLALGVPVLVLVEQWTKLHAVERLTVAFARSGALSLTLYEKLSSEACTRGIGAWPLRFRVLAPQEHSRLGARQWRSPGFQRAKPHPRGSAVDVAGRPRQRPDQFLKLRRVERHDRCAEA